MKRVVIVDDSSFLTKQLKVFFETVMGFKVVGIGTDGAQAVELYREHKPDLITLDITMPNKDGMEALTEILAIDPEACVMMISAVRGTDITKCMKIGAKGYMEKPLLFTSAEFVEDFKESIQEVFEP